MNNIITVLAGFTNKLWLSCVFLGPPLSVLLFYAVKYAEVVSQN